MPFSTDTRTLQPGDTFVAIRGETYDGHDFVVQAVAKGAARVVVERAVDVPEQIAVTVVEDSVAYLVAEARAKLTQLQPTVVAITGSIGKTTTRAAIAATLAEAFPVVASEGNKNTPLGLALLLLNRTITPDTKLVLEMGARLPGDLRDLCTYFPPTISVVTNVRGVHVETLGSIEGVQHEKSELVRALDASGTAILNGDDPRVRAMADVNAGRTILYGRGNANDLRPDRITEPLPMLGEHAVLVALAAYGVGHTLGMTPGQILTGLGRTTLEKGRLNQLRGRGDSVLIDDTYNASPDPVRVALRVLRDLKVEGPTRRIAFLGDMLELGDDEIAQHAEVLTYAAELADAVHTVGPRMTEALALLPDGLRERVVSWPSSQAVADEIRASRIAIEPGDVALVKGSQGMRMERVSEALLHPDLDPADHLPRQSTSWKQIA
ncbi:MAG: UDP-N-acetylmuramoyl-tripeptide--D-alanyl-D-alanine ligase [Bacteroidota bacterium]